MLKKYRAQLWLWHRRLGYLLVLVLMAVSVTGLLLNHTKALQLSHRAVNAQWLLQAYGFSAPQVLGQQLHDVWVAYLQPQIAFNGQPVQACHGTYVGAALVTPLPNLPAHFAVACGGDLLLLAKDGQLVERWGSSYGLPTPLNALGACENQPNSLCFTANNHTWQVNLEEGTWQQTAFGLTAAPLQHLPEEYAKRLQQTSLQLSWERVILDVHAGRILGLGPWLLDALAVGIILLGLSGLFSALSRRWK